MYPAFCNANPELLNIFFFYMEKIVICEEMNNLLFMFENRDFYSMEKIVICEEMDNLFFMFENRDLLMQQIICSQ